METTMAATPKALIASAPASSSSPLAFPVPLPPASTHRMMPSFAFPPPNDPNGPTRAQEIRPTRRTTVRVPRPNGASAPDALAGIAAWIEQLPLPALPDEVWSFIGRAWFFIAGTTMGVLLALALVAVTGPKRPAPREVHAVSAQSTARALVIQRVPSAPERGIGALAENDIDDVAPTTAPAPRPVTRRAVTIARRPVAPVTRNANPATKDLLSAGL